jgi:hypothetical protein
MNVGRLSVSANFSLKLRVEFNKMLRYGSVLQFYGAFDFNSHATQSFFSLHRMGLGYSVKCAGYKM